MRHFICMMGILMFLTSCSQGTINESDAGQDSQVADDTGIDAGGDGSINDSMDASDTVNIDDINDASNTTDSNNENDSGDSCQPATCESVGAKCGTIDNLCGSTLSCDNTCSNQETCEGNQCVCSYNTCNDVCCQQGEICQQGSDGCCAPTCTGKCGGTNDGCNGTCDGNCPSGQWCNVEACAVCNLDAHCGPNCDNCASQGNNRACVNDGCGCNDQSDCATGEQCQGVICSGCTSDCSGKCGGANDGCNGTCNGNCASGQWCNGQACAVCDVPAHCGTTCVDCTGQPSNTMCLTDHCGCTGISHCAFGQTCFNDVCCTPNWQDTDVCDCQAGPCAGCDGYKNQADGCGNTRSVTCSLPATGCATFCCQTTCINPNDPQNCGGCGVACDEGFICLGSTCTASDMRGADEVYFIHPWITDGIDDRIRGQDDPPPVHKFVIMMWQMGPTADDTIVTWPVGDRTGFYPSAVGAETFQRGPNNSYGSTAAQMLGNELGILINTASQAYTGNILPIVASHDWPFEQNIRPWLNPGSALSYSFWLQVPTAVRGGQIQLYVTPVFAFRDALNNVPVWMTAQAFDPRGYGSGENIICDCCSTCSKSMIIMSTIIRGMQWSHPTIDSSLFSDITWNGYRYFEYRVSFGEFAKAVNALADNVAGSGITISRAPQDYVLAHFNMNPETSTLGGPGDGQIGLSVKDIRIARYRAVYDTVRIGIANGGPDSELQVFFKTEGDAGFSEPKSVLIPFPANGGAWVELAANLGSNSLYRGTITGLRIDPFNANQPFGIDYVYVCSRDAANHVNDCIRAWDFNNGPIADGWTLSGIGNLWINNPGDEGHWGGVGTNGDPFFYTGTDFDCGQ